MKRKATRKNKHPQTFKRVPPPPERRLPALALLREQRLPARHLPGKFPTDMRTPPLEIQILLEPNPLESGILARRLAVNLKFPLHLAKPLPKPPPQPQKRLPPRHIVSASHPSVHTAPPAASRGSSRAVSLDVIRILLLLSPLLLLLLSIPCLLLLLLFRSAALDNSSYQLV